MLTFLDGPAEGKRGLLVQRAPLFVRVTFNADGHWDFLDLVEDTPAPTEQVWAYRLVKNDGHCHISRTVNGRRCGGFYIMATYRYIPEQPADEALRDNARWQTWTREQHKKEQSNDSAL